MHPINIPQKQAVSANLFKEEFEHIRPNSVTKLFGLLTSSIIECGLTSHFFTANLQIIVFRIRTKDYWLFVEN